MVDEQNKQIVIATQNIEKAIFLLAKEFEGINEIEIRYTEKYAGTVEYLLRLMRPFILEMERGKKAVPNTKCLYNNSGVCSEKDKKDSWIQCDETIRSTCKEYKRKFNGLFTVQYVVVERFGQAKDIK